MTLSKDHVEVLKRVLQEVCEEGVTIPRYKIHSVFENKTKSGIEKYKFERDLSQLIKQGKISGYELKAGCNGGVARTEPIERVTVICSTGKYMGVMPASKVLDFISTLQKASNKGI
jgi:hypothetical protein